MGPTPPMVLKQATRQVPALAWKTQPLPHGGGRPVHSHAVCDPEAALRNLPAHSESPGVWVGFQRARPTHLSAGPQGGVTTSKLKFCALDSRSRTPSTCRRGWTSNLQHWLGGMIHPGHPPPLPTTSLPPSLIPPSIHPTTHPGPQQPLQHLNANQKPVALPLSGHSPCPSFDGRDTRGTAAPTHPTRRPPAQPSACPLEVVRTTLTLKFPAQG